MVALEGVHVAHPYKRASTTLLPPLGPSEAADLPSGGHRDPACSA